MMREESSQSVILFVVRGRAEVPRVTFRRGVEVPPLAVGTDGDWSISADGVADVAFFLAFDGEDAQVVANAPGVTLNGAALGKGWHRFRAPCEVRFGDAVVRSSGRRARTPPPVPAVRPRIATTPPRGPALASSAPAAWTRAEMPSEPTLFDDRLRREAIVPTREADEPSLPQLGSVTPDAWAQAELFYDCEGAFEGAECNADEEALWHFHWRPRMRLWNAPFALVKTPVLALEGIFRAKLALDFGGSASHLTPENAALMNELGSNAAGASDVFIH